MQAFDASAIVHAWDNYPVDQFPPVWKWIETEIKAKRLVMSQVALDEVGHVAPECRKWLLAAGLVGAPVSGTATVDANRIKKLIGVVGDAFHPNGVDENDLLIIASARELGLQVVSEERQPTAPNDTKKYKIPTVCKLGGVKIPCCTFIEYLKQSKQVFAK